MNNKRPDSFWSIFKYKLNALRLSLSLYSKNFNWKQATALTTLSLGGLFGFAGCVDKNQNKEEDDKKDDIIQEQPVNPKPDDKDPVKPDPEPDNKPDPKPDDKDPVIPNPGEDEKDPPEEVTYPETIQELTDEQKQLLVDYIDENYKESILRRAAFTNYTNIYTLAYDFIINDEKVTALYVRENEDIGMSQYFAVEFKAKMQLNKLIEALSKNKNVSDEILSVNIKSTTKLNDFKIYKKENEYTENVENVYNAICGIQNNTSNNEKSIYSVKYNGDNISEELGIGLWPCFIITVINKENNFYSFNTISFITKDYNQIGKTEVPNYVLRENENYIFGNNQSTIFKNIETKKTFFVEFDGKKILKILNNSIERIDE